MPRPGTAIAVGLFVVATSVGCGAPVKSPFVASPSTIAAGTTTIPVPYVAAPVAPVTVPATVPHPMRPEAATRPVTAHLAPDPGDVGTFDRLAQCESGGNWADNTGNGYSGGLQFSPGTWRSVGGNGEAWQATREEQIARGQILARRSGFGQWPSCARRLGLI